MNIPCLQLKCDECCKRYWIPVLPEETSQVAKGLKEGQKSFIARKCILVAALYKCTEPRQLTITSSFLPKKSLEQVQGFFGEIPQYFLALPYLALLRKNNGECVFLKKKKCSIHDFSPVACRLFPFISTTEQKAPEAYPFCPALKQKEFENSKTIVDSKNIKKMRKYFDSVKEKGFLSQYPSVPNRAILLLEGVKEIPLEKKEFLETIKPLL